MSLWLIRYFSSGVLCHAYGLEQFILRLFLTKWNTQNDFSCAFVSCQAQNAIIAVLNLPLWSSWHGVVWCGVPWRGVVLCCDLMVVVFAVARCARARRSTLFCSLHYSRFAISNASPAYHLYQVWLPSTNCRSRKVWTCMPTPYVRLLRHCSQNCLKV